MGRNWQCAKCSYDGLHDTVSSILRRSEMAPSDKASLVIADILECGGRMSSYNYWKAESGERIMRTWGTCDELFYKRVKGTRQTLPSNTVPD